MCILCGNYVYLFECILDFAIGALSFVSRFFIDGICVVALALAA